MDAKRRREDHEHELRVLQLLAGGVNNHSYIASGGSGSSYNTMFEEDTNY